MSTLKNLKNRFGYLAPLALGLYCLVHGAGLAMSSEPLTQLLGSWFWLWVPGCAYFTWRGYKASAVATPTAEPTLAEAQLETEEALG